MSRIIFHIDVNSAFLSWSALEKLRQGSPLDLRDVPSIIGGDIQTRHGVVLAKSIPAKAYGIKTGEPVVSAFKKCPSLIAEPPCHQKYREYSNDMMTLLHSFTPDLEQISIDECFLDFGPISHLYESPLAAAHLFKDAIHEQLGFTVNVGVSSNRLLAKMASDFRKPDLVHTLFPQEIPKKMWPLPVENLYMVGNATASRLHQLGIHTIGELAHTDPHVLQSHFHSHGKLIWAYANGMDETPVTPQKKDVSSVGNSLTLPENCTSQEEAFPILMGLSEKVSGRLRKAEFMAQTIQVDIKYSSFQRSSHQTSLLSPTDTTQTIYETTCRLFREMWKEEPIRLLGVTASHLIKKGEPYQISLFDLDAAPEGNYFHTGKCPVHSPEKNSTPIAETNQRKGISPQKQKKLDAALDSIRSRYGENAVKRGSQIE
ncbi:MAG: DNA polymerase IV [Clostridiales bacterium]|nr:DNA polymerase IV [Clostridiales bacterium]